jgi:hypothetical protein
MKSWLYILGIALFIGGCNNVEDATPADHSSFIKFFHGPYNYEGVELEILPDGYALLGNITISDDSVATFLINTDKHGNQLGETVYFPGTKAKSFEVIRSGDIVSGYLIVGDSIKINPGASRVGDIEVYSTRIMKVDNDGNIVKQLSYTDNSEDSTRVKIDYKSSSLRILYKQNPDRIEVLALGTYREDLSRPEKSFVVSFDEDLNLNWYKEYDLLDAGQTDYNYVNARSLHCKDDFIIWASAILKPTQSFNDSYLAVPFVKEGSVFNNFSQYGETSSQYFLARDIQPAYSHGLGYGVVGTRGETDGSKANMFFVRIDVNGNFIQNSVRYFDAALSTDDTIIENSQSESQEQGEALTSTQDGGYVLAGATQSGNEARNIYLVKVNSVGNIVWSKVLGGTGDELVSSIRETSDGSLVLCGTNTLSGLSSIFVIKVDSKGELKN